MKKKLTILIASILTITVLSLFLFKLPQYVRRVSIVKLEEGLGRKVSSGKFRYNYFTATVHLEDFKIMEPNEKDVFLSLDSFIVNVDPTKFIFKKIYFKKIALINPTLRLVLDDDRTNFDDILENISSKKPEGAEPDKDSDSYFEKVEVKNITIDKFNLYYKDKILKGEDAFTFISPRLEYKDNILDLSTKLMFSKKDSLDFFLNSNFKNGDLSGRLDVHKLTLENNLYIPKKFIGENIASGEIRGDILFNGNLKDNNLLLSGELFLENILLEDPETNENLAVKSGNIKINSLTLPKIDLDLETFIIDGLNVDVDNFLESLPEKSQAREEKIEDTFSFKLKELSLKNSSILAKETQFNNINIVGRNLVNEKDGMFPLTASFDIEDKLSFSSNSVIKLHDVLKSGSDIKSIASLKGDLDIAAKDLSTLKKLGDMSVDLNSGPFTMKGNYDFSFPKLSIFPSLTVEELKASDKKNYNFSLERGAFSKGSLILDMKEGSYSLSGPAVLKKLEVATIKNKNIFNGDASLDIKELSNKNIHMNSVFLNKLSLDLRENLTQEKTKESKEQKEEIPNINISKLKIGNGNILLNDFSLDNLTLSSENLSSFKGESPLELSFKFKNQTAVSAKGKVIRKKDISQTSDTSNISFDGRVTVPSIDLKELKPFLSEIPYDLSGRSSIESDLSYSLDLISSKNKISFRNLKALNTDNSDEISLNSGSGSFNFDLKNKSSSLSKGIFTLSNFSGFFNDRSLSLKSSATDLNIARASKEEFILNSVVLIQPVIKQISRKKTEKKEESKDRIKFFMKKFTARDGTFAFSSPTTDYTVTHLQITGQDISTSAKEKGSITVKGLVQNSGDFDGNANYSLGKDWDFSLKTMDTDGGFSINNLDLLTFKDTLAKYLPNEIDSGEISWKSDFNLDSGKIKSGNNVTIKNIKLGKETGNNTSMPLTSAVSLLTDKNDLFTLNIPVTGDLNNPKFKLRDLFLQNLRIILLKVITSPKEIVSKVLEVTVAKPFEVVSNVLKGSGATDSPVISSEKEISSIRFEFLAETLSSSEIEKMHKIVKTLSEEPVSRVVFILYTDPAREKELLRFKLLKELLFQFNKSALDIDSEMEQLINRRRDTLMNFFKANSLESRVTIKISQERKIYPQASVEFLTN